MEEFVQLKLETYERMQVRSNTLESYTDEIEKLNDFIIALYQYILNMELQTFFIENYSLEEVTNPECYVFGIHNYDELLKLGITEEEMIDFITKKWNEMHQGEQENA